MSQTQKVAVVYLAWVPYGPDHLRLFIASYLKYAAGHPHELYILFNGVEKESELDVHLQILRQQRVTFKMIIHKNGQDLEAYREAATQIEAAYILFLNTYSRLLHTEWLSRFYNALNKKNVGLVGATASWQSYYSTVFQVHPFRWETSEGFQHNYRKYKLFIKAFLYWSFLFKPFPNPHIRSNGFCIRRDLFLSLHFPAMQNKFQAYRFESGRRGMTRQVLNKGYEVAVIDRLGNAYDLQHCKDKGLFWSGNQENLLLSDNQTRKYDDADSRERQRLYRLAWGK